MAVLPTPTGTSPLPNLTTPAAATRAQAVASYAQFITSTYGETWGTSFQDYASAHPSETANAALNAWADTVAASLGPGLAKAIGDAVTGDANLTAEAGAGTVAGLDATEQTFFGGFLGFLKDLTSRAFWLRAAKVAGGLALIVVGLVQLTHAQKLVETVGEAAAIA
jgi:hypothetical protein